VIGIIVLLAGLMIPAVISSKTKGQITEAKADMAAIKMALTAVERDYKTIFKLDSNFNVTGGDIAKNADSYDSNRVKVVRYDGSSSTEINRYNALIRELTVPGDVNRSNKNFNHRNIKYLDPREDYNTSDDATLWRDPWGNPYTILVCTNSADKVYLPYTNANVQNAPDNHDGSNMVLRGKVFVYSWGPNGEDNNSFNADNGGFSTTDDVRGWEK
jgi:type II secretory pathway pseudopilin PulG